MGSGVLLNSIEYPYRPDGILPDGSKVPDIPALNLLLVRRDLGKALSGDSIIDTGFDGAIYANHDVVGFLEGLQPAKEAYLWAASHKVRCEVFDIECYVVDLEFRPVVPLGKVEVHVPVTPEDISEDVILGRIVLNRLRLELDGKHVRFIHS